MRYILLAKSYTGKDEFIEKLKNKGMTVFNDAQTKYDGNDIQSIIECNHVIATDPKNAIELVKNSPETGYMIIYLTSTLDNRLIRATENECEALDCLTFGVKGDSKDKQYDEFRDKYLNPHGANDLPNIKGYIPVNMDATDDDINACVTMLVDNYRICKCLSDMLTMCITGGLLEKGSLDNTVKAYTKEGNEYTETDNFVDCISATLAGDNEQLITLVKMWLLYVSDICPSLIDAIYSYPDTKVD